MKIYFKRQIGVELFLRHLIQSTLVVFGFIVSSDTSTDWHARAKDVCISTSKHEEQDRILEATLVDSSTCVDSSCRNDSKACHLGWYEHESCAVRYYFKLNMLCWTTRTHKNIYAFTPNSTINNSHESAPCSKDLVNHWCLCLQGSERWTLYTFRNFECSEN